MFAVTNYWESKNAEVEIKQGKAMADAAKVGCSLSESSYTFLTPYRKPVCNISSSLLS